MINKDECTLLTLNNAPIIGISETKLSENILSSELDVDKYDLIGLHRSRRGGVGICYIKRSIAYSQRNFLQ